MSQYIIKDVIRMAYAMTKQGSLDNCITYEFICDTVADMNAIENKYKTIGTVAIVLAGESEGMEVYIAGSDKSWNNVGTLGASGDSSAGAGLSIHICAQNEVSNGVPSISSPDENTIYLVSSGNTSGNLYEEYIYVNNAWENFGAASIDLSGKADKTDTVLNTTLSRGRTANSSVGNGSFAFGNDVTASGIYSHSEGWYTIASGNYSHAEGKSTNATAPYTHSEGQTTTASEENAHAEGQGATASGNASHAEGTSTTASGVSSHAEGYLTYAKGEYSHVEGNQTSATGKYSHAQGEKTKATLDNAHAAGYMCEANAWNSTAIGRYSRVLSSDRNAFVWQGLHQNTFYESKGQGTFCINPAIGLSGFYIGKDNFIQCVLSAVQKMSSTQKNALKTALGI